MVRILTRVAVLHVVLSQRLGVCWNLLSTHEEYSEQKRYTSCLRASALNPRLLKLDRTRHLNSEAAALPFGETVPRPLLPTWLSWMRSGCQSCNHAPSLPPLQHVVGSGASKACSRFTCILHLSLSLSPPPLSPSLSLSICL